MSKKKQSSILVDIFVKAGFVHVESDEVHFCVGGQEGEIDHIFVWENLVVLCEETTGGDVSHHLPKKAIFHNIIKNSFVDFFKNFSSKNNKLMEVLEGNEYEVSDVEMRFIYYSAECEVSDGIMRNSDPFKILKKSEALYFKSLVDSIEGSSKYDLLRYLDVSLQDVGEGRRSGSGVMTKSFPGLVIPTKHTRYPDEFLIVSFYANPNSLIKRAFVSRRNGWQEPHFSYQRLIDKKRIRTMRENLSHEEEVYINNLIVTLSSDVEVKDYEKNIICGKELRKTTSVNISIPEELGTVVIIDGQHRLFSYFDYTGDGNSKSGEIAKKIRSLGDRQNLLVTGIIFPKDYKGSKEVFEAKLFLSINKNQKNVDTNLQQDLEMMISPSSDIGIARCIIHKLSQAGALSKRLKISPLDEENLVDSGSLSKYVLKPLIKNSSPISSEWLREKGYKERDEKNYKDFIDYLYEDIRLFFGKTASLMQGKWKVPERGGVLSTTVVGGFINLWGKFVADYEKNERDYEKLLEEYKIKDIEFSRYTSSQWKKMADDVYRGRG